MLFKKLPHSQNECDQDLWMMFADKSWWDHEEY
jgi:hypothetical protein